MKRLARLTLAYLISATAAGITCADRAAADMFGSGANTFDIEFVRIGNPGNAGDTTGRPNSAGSVPYTYRMVVPSSLDSDSGFRVAVPEPSTLLFLCFGGLAALWRRRG